MRYSVGDKRISLTGTLVDAAGTAIDLDGYTRVYVRLFRPDGSSFTKDAVPSDAANLANGKITYLVTDATFLDVDGTWQWTVGAEWLRGTRHESPSRGVFRVM